MLYIKGGKIHVMIRIITSSCVDDYQTIHLISSLVRAYMRQRNTLMMEGSLRTRLKNNVKKKLPNGLARSLECSDNKAGLLFEFRTYTL